MPKNTLELILTSIDLGNSALLVLKWKTLDSYEKNKIKEKISGLDEKKAMAVFSSLTMINEHIAKDVFSDIALKKKETKQSEDFTGRDLDLGMESEEKPSVFVDGKEYTTAQQLIDETFRNRGFANKFVKEILDLGENQLQLWMKEFEDIDPLLRTTIKKFINEHIEEKNKPLKEEKKESPMEDTAEVSAESEEKIKEVAAVIDFFNDITNNEAVIDLANEKIPTIIENVFSLSSPSLIRVLTQIVDLKDHCKSAMFTNNKIDVEVLSDFYKALKASDLRNNDNLISNLVLAKYNSINSEAIGKTIEKASSNYSREKIK